MVITLGSHQYTTTVDASGNWSVGVPASVISALTDGTVTLSATITDSAGNSSTQTHDVVVNTASVALTVNTVSGDDVINAAEAGSSLVINGSSAQFASGTQVTVTLNGKTYTATIQNDGTDDHRTGRRRGRHGRWCTLSGVRIGTGQRGQQRVGNARHQRGYHCAGGEHWDAVG